MGLPVSHHNASKSVHRSLNIPFHLIPIRTSFSKFIYFLGAPDTRKPIRIRNDGSKCFGIRRVDQVNLGQFAKSPEIKEEVVILQTLNELEVVVHVARSYVRTDYYH